MMSTKQKIHAKNDKMKRSEVEDKITNFWEENKTFEKSVEQRPKENQYVFYDGPPFATGLPHHGHILGLVSKDLFPRYHTMKGQRVERRWGWDCHGLPIENIVEKDLKIKNKKEIEDLGIDKFNEEAKTKVLHFVDEWKKTVDRIGKWIEFDNSYKTMDQSYMETVWHIFKTLYDKKMIYEGKKVLMYCPRCETPLANSEIQMDNSYKDVTEKTATVGFKLKDKDEYILAWTTTPWTLIGNVALAINPKLEYVKVDVFGKKFILAKELVEKNFEHFEIIESVEGKDLINLEYEPLYEVETNGKKGYYVIDGGEEVTCEDGTGIVHMAAYGEFDYSMIKKYDLPLVQHVNGKGLLEEGPEKWKGLWFKKVDGEVLEDLYQRGLLVESKQYTHSYPFCYRCETPLMYHAVNSWFVDIINNKEKLMKKAESINWHPENVKTRFNHILETAPDWSISRNRFWATAIPVWKSESGEIKVIGSIEELKKEAIEEVDDNIDLHKHVIDKIHLKSSTGEIMTRIPEVIDCWFESGSMPYAAKHFPFENEDWLKENFPADFISEYIAQVRAWFYYMHVIGTLFMDSAPFKHCVVSGNILAADGAKMSKSKKNYTDPNKILDEYGADAMRFYLMSTPVMRAGDISFIDDSVKEVNRKLLTLLTNVNRFYSLFGSNNKVIDNGESKNILDKWILSKTNRLIKDTTKNLDDYNTVRVCNDIINFVEDLSTWYVRRSRDRFRDDDKEAKETLSFVLNNLSKLIAPVTPFIAEEIYQSIRGLDFENGEKSVHLENWPEFDEGKINDELEEEMSIARSVVSKALEARTTAKLPVKQPLAKVTVLGPKVNENLFDIIKDELNVKDIEVKEENSEEVEIELDTNITEELKVEGIARELTRQINALRKKSGLTLDDRIEANISTDSDLIKKAVDTHGKEISESTQTDNLEIKENDGKEITIGEEKLLLNIIKK
jgi:isoleucyl-tRNA synthetase